MKGGSVRGAPARIAMIEAAERLVAQQGYAAVSMREIGAAAGQRNNSAAQYHFGSRAQLMAAVFEYRMSPINERRLALLADGAAPGGSDGIRALVEALVLPLAETIGDQHGPTYYARFLNQAAFDPDLHFFDSMDRPVLQGFRIVIEGLLNAMAHLPLKVSIERVLLINRLVVTALADRERLATMGDGEESWRNVSPSEVIDLAVAMVGAPMSSETRRGAVAQGWPDAPAAPGVAAAAGA